MTTHKNSGYSWLLGGIIFLASIICSFQSSHGQAIEATVADAVKQCGGRVVRDAQTGRITEVDVAATRSSVDDATFALIVQLEGLKKLSVSGSTLSEASLKKLENLGSLEELYLVDTATSDTDLANLCKALPKLKRLTLRRLVKISNQGLESLHELKELRNLSLLSLPISRPGLEIVVALPTLRALDLRGCIGLNADDYRLLAKATNLVDLKIGGASINAEVLRTVAALPNLTGLAVEDATVSAEIWDELFAIPQWSNNMTSLAFARMYSVNDRVLEKLSGFKKLRTLSLRAVPVRGTFVANLAPDSPLFDTLQTLGMTKNYATKDEILSLARFRNLKKLDFSNTTMTPDKVEALSTLERLETLILMECQLSDELLSKLVPLKNLSSLEIAENPALTAKSHATLRRFPKLALDNVAMKPVKILYYTRSVSAQHSPVVILADGESVSDKMLKKWGAQNNMEFVCTKDGRIFDGDLDQFDGFAFYSAGDLDAEVSLDGSPPMSKEGKARMLEAVRNGKGFVGFHATSDSWRDVNHPPYENQENIDPFLEMLGGEFYVHGSNREEKMLITQPTAIPWLKDKGEFFAQYEEWYCLKNFNKDIHVILTQDTSTMLDEEVYNRPPYPATWARLHGKGRVAYTSLGHFDEIWQEDAYLQFFGELISWSVGRFDMDLTPNMDQVTPGASILQNPKP